MPGQEGPEGRHLDARQGPGAMRARDARGADRRPAQNDSRCGRDTRKVRRQPATHSGFAGARGRCGRRLPRHRWDRSEDGRRTFKPLRADRKLPSNILGKQRDLALLFKKLATLRTDAPLFKKVETLRWRGATPAFAAWAKRMEAPQLMKRCHRVKLRHAALQQ